MPAPLPLMPGQDGSAAPKREKTLRTHLRHSLPQLGKSAADPSSQHVQALPGVTGNLFIRGYEDQVLGYGLCDQHPVEGVLMHGR